MRGQVHTFDSEATFLNGAQRDITWGITAGSPWTRSKGAQVPSEDADIRFMLPTVHYFIEVPQRLTEVPLVRYAGQETVRGTVYDVVFGTWESLEASARFDQYKIYLDPETSRIAKLYYTVREAGGLARGACHFDDVRSIEGYWLAHRMTVTAAIDDDPAAGWLHEMVISEFAFDP
jgi:hypothetical protein